MCRKTLSTSQGPNRAAQPAQAVLLGRGQRPLLQQPGESMRENYSLAPTPWFQRHPHLPPLRATAPVTAGGAPGLPLVTWSRGPWGPEVLGQEGMG